MKIKHILTLAPVMVVFLWACQSKDPETASGKKVPPKQLSMQEQLAEQSQLLEGIKSELQGIRKLLEQGGRRPSAQEDDQPRTVSIDDDYIRGQADAKLTLIEFSDFQCPFCERFFRETLPLIEKDYISTGKVRMVYRDFPIAGAHKDALKAAEAAQCAGEQGKYWEMHDMIFKNQKAMRVDNLKQYARKLKLAAEQFDKCIDSGKYAEEVKKDLMDGKAAGVEGTPTFFLGRTGKDRIIQGFMIGGARPYALFKQAFDKLLQENEKKNENTDEKANEK